MAMRAKSRVSRDKVYSKHGPSTRGRPPDGAIKAESGKVSKLKHRLTGTTVTSHEIFEAARLSRQASTLEFMWIPAELKIHAVTAETLSDSGSSSGGGKEWVGPTWKFTQYTGMYGALYNLLGNAELMTPIGPKFTPEPMYRGEGLSPPQKAPMHCAFDNLYDFNTAKAKAQKKALSATYHSQRERSAHYSDLAPAVEPSVLDPPNRGAGAQVEIVGPPAPSIVTSNHAANDVEVDDVEINFLGVNFALKLQLNGVAYLSPCTQVALAGDGMVEIHHRLDNGAVWYKAMSEYALQELIDMRIGCLSPSDMESNTSVKVASAEVLLQIPTERTHELMGYEIDALEKHWAERRAVAISRRLKEVEASPIEYYDDGRAFINVYSIVEKPLPVAITMEPVDPDVHVSELYWIHQDYMKAMCTGLKHMPAPVWKPTAYAHVPPTLLSFFHQEHMPRRVPLNTEFNKWRTTRETVAYALLMYRQEYGFRIIGVPYPEEMHDATNYQLWLMDRDVLNYSAPEDQSKDFFLASRKEIFIESTTIPMDIPTLTPEPRNLLEDAKGWLNQKWGQLKVKVYDLAAPPVEEGEATTVEEVVVIGTTKVIANRILSGRDINNDQANIDMAQKLSQRLNLELDPRQSPPRVEAVALALAAREEITETFSSGGIFLGKASTLARGAEGIVLLDEATPPEHE